MLRIALLLIFFWVLPAHSETVNLSLSSVPQLQNDSWSCGVHSAYRILKGGYDQNVDYVEMRSRVTPYDPFRLVLVPGIIEPSLDFNTLRIGQPTTDLASSIENNYRGSARVNNDYLVNNLNMTEFIKDQIWNGIPVMALIQVGSAATAGLNHAEGCVGFWLWGECIGFYYSIDAKHPLLHWIVITGYDNDGILYQDTKSSDGVYRMTYPEFEAKRNWQIEPYNGDIAGVINGKGVRPRDIIYFPGDPLPASKVHREGERFPNLSASTEWGGRISSSDGGIDCGAKCSNKYRIGSQVTLTVSGLPAGATVRSWDGAAGCQANSNSCTVTVNAGANVTARIDCPSCVKRVIIASMLFDDSYQVTVAKSGTGSGSVVSVDKNINCGTSCLANYGDGEEITLGAVPTIGNKFDGWSGDCTGTQLCTVKIDKAKRIQASFSPTQTKQSVSIEFAGSGRGKVTSTPNGIDCNANCRADFVSGTTITFTAVPETGYTFAGWSNGCTGSSNACSVVATNPVTVKAQFDVSSAPVCTLTANPSSIAAGASSTLTATCKPTPTSYIWTGGTCAGSGATCTVTPTETTTYTVQGANSGGTKPAVSVTVTVGASIPPVCTLTATPSSVSSGGSSTLTATCSPTANSYTWTGGTCAGTTGSICMVKPTAATTYTVKGSNAVGTGAAASAMVSVSPPDTCNVAPVSRPAGLALVGTANNEQFSNGAGNDRIDGAGGIDTMIFGCNRASYTITQTTTGWTVQSDAEGLDILTNIERLRFADKTLALDIASEAGKNAGKGYRIYQGDFQQRLYRW